MKKRIVYVSKVSLEQVAKLEAAGYIPVFKGTGRAELNQERAWKEFAKALTGFSSVQLRLGKGK